jgi:hypothetical protein
LVYLGNGRYYDPTIGRPLQPNPAGASPTMPQAENQLQQAVRHCGTSCITGANNPVETISFTYDADGMMVLRNDNGQRTVYLGKLYQRKLFATGIGQRNITPSAASWSPC